MNASYISALKENYAVNFGRLRLIVLNLDMKIILSLICGLLFACCCKQRITSPKIEMHFVGFNPFMSSVKVISLSFNRFDTTIVTLDANKRGVYTLLYERTDSLIITGTDPNKFLPFKMIMYKVLSNGSGCGGPADEGQTSFTFKDSVYSFANYHKIEVIY